MPLRKGFAALELLLVLAVIGIIGGTSWFVWKAKQSTNKSLDNSKNTIDQLSKQNSPSEGTAEANIPDSFTTFESKDYEFKFSYPKTWGNVTLTKYDGMKGNHLNVKFAKQQKVVAGLLSTDFEPFGKDGGCFVYLGIYAPTGLANEKSNFKEGDSMYNTASYKSTTHILVSKTNEFIYEHFEAGVVDGMGYCPGLSASGSKVFSDKKYTGIQFFWADNASDSVPLSQFDAYKVNHNQFWSEEDRQDFILTVNSAAGSN